MNSIRQQATEHFDQLAQRFFQQPDCVDICVRDVCISREAFADQGHKLMADAMDACWHDGYSDVDLLVRLRGNCPKTAAARLHWLRRIGVTEEQCLGYLAAEDSGACRVVFRDGFRYDITLEGTGGDGCPEEASFCSDGEHPALPRAAVNRFWFVQVQALGKLYRQDYLIGRHLAHVQLNETLVLQMVQRDLQRGTNHHRYGNAEAAVYQQHQDKCPFRTGDKDFDQIADALCAAACAYDELVTAFYPDETPRTPVLMQLWQRYHEERCGGQGNPAPKGNRQAVIRRATVQDASRLAEILIFTKRVNYRRIFQNDQVSFGEMQVYPLAKSFLDAPETLVGYWVYEDGFVKGLIRMDGTQIMELYVDSFFAGQGIGGALMRFAVEQCGCDHLWALEKNEGAIRFYQRHGFALTGEKTLQEGTPEYLVLLRR